MDVEILPIGVINLVKFHFLVNVTKVRPTSTASRPWADLSFLLRVTGQAPGRATAAGVLLEGNGLASSTFGTFVLEIILSQPVTAVPSTLVVYVKLVDLD